MELYQQRHYQFELKEMEKAGKNKKMILRSSVLPLPPEAFGKAVSSLVSKCGATSPVSVHQEDITQVPQ